MASVAWVANIRSHGIGNLRNRCDGRGHRFELGGIHVVSDAGEG